ncbi:anti-sigma factor family protein [Perlabentimonas gracilis]|uniref:anti-sigma factor family protein n=1 Tax=Perlabentimonas gracilis TaxID=2715279 RepID=UPI00140C5E7E|nr:zf-HC2 domain-containing protein [Perlabentimonas gracilis]NHB67256.1 zf-HC2 domain-containing protein [Perlabentimonas gracilis]
MKCKEANINLLSYLDGELNTEQQSRVEQHLASCEQCQVALENLKQIYIDIKGEKEQYQPNPYLATKVWNRLQTSNQSVKVPVIPMRRSAIATLAAAGIAFGIAIGTLFNASVADTNGNNQDQWTQLADEYFPSDVFSPYEILDDNN